MSILQRLVVFGAALSAVCPLNAQLVSERFGTERGTCIVGAWLSNAVVIASDSRTLATLHGNNTLRYSNETIGPDACKVIVTSPSVAVAVDGTNVVSQINPRNGKAQIIWNGLREAEKLFASANDTTPAKELLARAEQWADAFESCRCGQIPPGGEVFSALSVFAYLDKPILVRIRFLSEGGKVRREPAKIALTAPGYVAYLGSCNQQLAPTRMDQLNPSEQNRMQVLLKDKPQNIEQLEALAVGFLQLGIDVRMRISFPSPSDVAPPISTIVIDGSSKRWRYMQQGVCSALP